jgi:hypothetical protein
VTLPEALQRLQAAGKIRSPWLPGMLMMNGSRIMFVDPDTGATSAHAKVYRPHAGTDLNSTDPATLGCLLALVREASGDSCVYIECGARDAATMVPVSWYVMTWGDEDSIAYGETEGAALAAALISLAEGL